MKFFAHFYILKVMMNETNSEIDKVVVLETNTGATTIMPKHDVIKRIHDGESFATQVKLESGPIEDQISNAAVHIYKKGTKEFLRTDRNEIEEDNLGELPVV